MAKRSRGDQPQSNTALIIFLVFSILLNLALGVFLYMSFAKVDDAEKAKVAALAAQKGAEDQRSAMEDIFNWTRKMIGDPSLMNDVANNAENKLPDALSKVQAPWVGVISRDLLGTQGAPGIIGTNAKATTNLINLIKTSTNERTNLTKSLNDSKTALAKLTDEFKRYQQDWNAQKQQDVVSALQKSNEQALANKIAQKDQVIAEANKKIDELNREVEKQLTDNKKSYEDKVKALTEFNEAFQQKLAQERREELEKRNRDKIVNLNAPKGKVIKLVDSGDLAWIDIGSDNKLPVGLTFAVHGTDNAGKPLPNPKAEVEVVSVNGPNMAQVRIKRVARSVSVLSDTKPDQPEFWLSNSAEFLRSNNAPLPGDLLYNPIWDANKITKIALAGDIDIDGDGQDDTQAFIRILKEWNVEVVFYLDRSANYAPRGRINYDTEFLVIGGVSTLSFAELNKPSTNAGTEMIKATEKADREAYQKAVERISLSNFLLRIGFTPIKLGQAPAAAAPSTPVEPGAAATPPAAGTENK